MKARHLFLTSLTAGLTLTLGACGDLDRPSVDVDGSCSSQFRTDYNAVRTEVRAKDRAIARGASATAKTEAWVGLDNACTTFFRHHSNVTCRASLDEDSTSETSISSRSWKETCDEAHRIVAAINGEGQPPHAPLPPTEVGGPIYAPPPKPQKPAPSLFTPIGEIEPRDLHITVASAFQFKRVLRNARLKMVRGDIGTDKELASSINFGATYCGATMSNSDHDKELNLITTGTELKVTLALDYEPQKPDEHQRSTVYGMIGSNSFLFSCSAKGPSKVTLYDLQAAVRGILEVSLKR